MHVDNKSLLLMMNYVTKTIVDKPEISVVHPDYALWEWASQTWIVAFWERPKRKSDRISYINFEIKLDDVLADTSPDRYVSYVNYHGLLSAFSIANLYMCHQTRFASAELYYALNITKQKPQWEIHFIAKDDEQQAYFVECQIDVHSSMIFNLSIDKAANPYTKQF